MIAYPSVESASAEYASFQETKKFAALDGLRCFSILAVIWHHATGIGLGYCGVQVFFAISGFLITTLLLRERRAFGDISLSKFYARRALRIFPLYYAALLIYVLLVYSTQRHLEAGREFFHNLPFFATYTSNWFVPLNGRVIFYFSWSLATEEQFYLVVPSLEKYLKNFAVVAIALVAGIHIASDWIPMGVVIAQISTPLCFGVLAAHALDNERGFRCLAAVTYPKFCSTLWLLAAIVMIWLRLPDVLLATAITGLVVSSIIRPDHYLAWFFNWWLFQSVGRVSYGMYMLHQLCLNVLKRVVHFNFPGTTIILFVVGSVLTYFVALASYRWYESVFLRMKNRFSHSG